MQEPDIHLLLKELCCAAGVNGLSDIQTVACDWLKKFADDVEKGIRISDTEPFPNDELGSISNNIVRLYARLQKANVAREKDHKAALFEQQEKERIKSRRK